MKTYFALIKYSQLILLGISILLLSFLPSFIVLNPEALDTNLLYWLAHFSLFLVMIVRPLADIFTKVKFIRPLVILRKGMGVFSASIVVSFIIAKIIIDPADYFSSFGTSAYWSLQNFALFAHLADISAVLLLITSNNLSKKLLGKGWKIIQKLSYVYFYGSAIYVFFIFSDYLVLNYMLIVTGLTLFAYYRNKQRLNKTL